jgi:hypothetical protein
VIGHHNLNPALAWSVARLRVTFVEADGTRPTVAEGTGFWIRTTDGHTVFVTNRHLVDPEFGLLGRSVHLERVEVAFRVRQNEAEFVYHPGDFLTWSNAASACLPPPRLKIEAAPIRRTGC